MTFKTTLQVLTTVTAVSLVTNVAAQRQTRELQVKPPRQTPATTPANKNKGLKAPELPYLLRLGTTPDVNQHMKREQLLVQIPKADWKQFNHVKAGERVFEGKDYCGPCTIANNLVWLRNNGHKQISQFDNPVTAGTKLAGLLGKKGFFNADAGGTSYKNMVNGTMAFLHLRGIKPKRVRIYSTVDRSNEDYKVGKVDFKFVKRVPTPQDFKNILRRKAIVAMIYGHYRPGGKDILSGSKRPWSTNMLYRTGGHWVAPVGYGKNSMGKLSPDTIIVRNSAGGQQSKQAFAYFDFAKVNTNNAKYNMAKLWRIKNGKTEDRGILNGHYAMTPLPTGFYEEGKSKKLEVLEGLLYIEL